MAGINDYSNTAGSNTTINGIDIAEGCSPAGINNAIRQLMADIADMDDGVVPLQTPDINGGTIDGASLGASSPITSAVISGDLTVDTNTLYVDSTNNRVGIGTSSPSQELHIVSTQPSLLLEDSDNNGQALIDVSGGNINISSDPTGVVGSSNIDFLVDNNQYMRIASGGDISFYEDTGTTPKFFWDASAESLAVGDSSVDGDASSLFLLGADPTGIDKGQLVLKGTATSGAADTGAGITFKGNNGSGNRGFGSIQVLKENSTVGNNDTYMRFSTRDNTDGYRETMRIDSSGKVGIGTSSPSVILDIAGEGTSGANNIYQTWSANSSGYSPAFNLRKSRGSKASPTVVQSGDQTGAIVFSGYDGTNHINTALIESRVDGTPGTNDMPGRLVFFTTADGSSSPTERMRITSSGNVGIGTSNPSNPLEVNYGTVGTGNGSNNALALVHNSSTMYAQHFMDGNGIYNIYADQQGVAGGNLTLHADNNLRFSTGTWTSALADVTINSSGNVGIGTSNPATRLHLQLGSSGATANVYSTAVLETNNPYNVLQFMSPNTDNQQIRFGDPQSNGAGIIQYAHNGNHMSFITDDTERMRIDSSGNLLVGRTDTNLNNDGFFVLSSGGIGIVRAGSAPVEINRKTNDGELISFRQDFTQEGTISVSGATVSYNGFTGTHWSRLSDNSKPTILKGTILESLDEMMDWYQVQFDITETDDEGNETTRTEKQSYALTDGESVGDVITYTYEGTDYQATIIQEGDVKHTKSKISDTVDAKNVYGVFMDWDNDDDTVNDMYVAQTGTFVVRLNSSVTTLNKGDLIQSNGDGTGKVQADDLLRASTVAKVLSTTKIETYDDGSYIVPCSLHC